jgi:hypothetical protein
MLVMMMNEVVEALASVESSISNLIKSVDMETAKDLTLSAISGGLSAVAARSKDLRDILGNQKAVVNTLTVSVSLMGSYFLTESLGCALLSLVPYAIVYALPSSQPQGKDDNFNYKG